MEVEAHRCRCSGRSTSRSRFGARDLLDRLTPDERLAMLHQAAPGDRAARARQFHTGCEALHGVAWLGTATVFPQPVGLAATWDADLIERVGEVAAVEVRAKHAENPLVSLNVWAPVVNTLRHPAWGRNEEGYSEDPHLTAHFGTAYSRGLRGDHPRVWRTVPTLKHFLGYSNETDRSATDSELVAADPPRGGAARLPGPDRGRRPRAAMMLVVQPRQRRARAHAARARRRGAVVDRRARSPSCRMPVPPPSS